MKLDWKKFFSMIIFGCPGSGKTHLLKSIIYTASIKQEFDHCLLFSSTKNSPDYSFLKDEFKYDAFDLVAIENYINFCKSHNEKKITTRGLLIFDDIAGDQSLKSSLFKSLLSNYRHYGINIIIINQMIVEVPLSLRSIIKYGCVYKYVNENDREKIYTCFGSLTSNKHEFFQLYDKFTAEKFMFLFFSQCDMYDSGNAYCGMRAPKKIPKFLLKFD